MKNEFCHACGKRLVEKLVKGFNTSTGLRNTKLRCPSEECEHTGYFHDFEYGGFWSFGKMTCKKYGYVTYAGGY